MSYPMVELSELILKRNGSVNPTKFLDETFELHSIPAFDKGHPEILKGSEIGSSKQIVRENDVMISKIVPHIRRASVVPKAGEFRQIASGEWIVFRSERFEPNYLKHVLVSDNFNTEFMATVSGVGGSLLRARPAFVEKIKIPLPSLEEQRRIAAILDQADALRQKRQQSLEKLDQLLQATFHDYFGDLVINPKKFPEVNFESIIKFTGGSQPAKSTFSDTYKEGYIRLVQIRDFRTDKYMTYIPESMARRKFKENDVMIGRYGPPVFQILRGLQGAYNVALMKAEPKIGLDNEFLFHLLSLNSIQKLVISNSQRSAGQTGVNLDFLNKLIIGLPPLNLQKEWAEIALSIDLNKKKISEQLNYYDDLFKSLQQKAFTGRL